MMSDLGEFFQESRWSSFDHILALAGQITAIMKNLGMEDVRLIEFPADGRTFFGGWVLPKAYDIEDASLTRIVEGEGEVLADYRSNPTCLMMYSQPTPAEGVAADLVVADTTDELRPERVSGRFVLTAGPSVPYTQAAAKAGACGVIADYRGARALIKDGPYLDEATQWHNYAIPPWDAPRKGFGFALTPNQGKRLRARLQAGERVRLHAVVKGRQYDGVLPVISGRLPGKSPEEIALTGHYDEFGADDNCSQLAVALEAVRALRAMVESGELPPLLRSVRLLFPMEVRGFNALVQSAEEVRHIRMGLNVDAIGTDQNRSTSCCTVTENFAALPSFADDFVAELLDRLGQSNELFRWRIVGADTIDNIFGEPLIGAPTPSLYHFSGTHHLSIDTPERISGRALVDMAQVATTFAAFLANAGLEEAVWLSDLAAERGCQRIRHEAALALRGEKGETKPNAGLERLRGLHERYRRKAASAAWLVPAVQPFLPTKELVEKNERAYVGKDRLFPRESYADQVAGILERLDRSLEEAEALIRSRTAAYFRPGTEAIEAPEESRCVPVKAFRGFLAFEDLDGEEQRYVREELKLPIGWGAPMWLNHALMFANGKRTVSDIVRILRCQGLGSPEVRMLEKTFAFLARRGLVRFRQYVAQSEVRDALWQAGLRPGDLVLGHFSLSQFGYVEGGCDGLIETLLALLEPSGTLMMPTFAFSWIGNRPYDPRQTASRVGKTTDAFWRRPGVLRSAHPTHSFAATGPLASQFLAGHDHTMPPISRDGPIGRLADADGKILMFCSAGRNTCMHAGDYWSGIPFVDLLCHIVENGERKEVIVPDCPWHASFDKTCEKLRIRGLSRDIPLGESEIHVMKCRDAIEAQAEIARNTPEALLPAGCECPYCQRLRRYCEERGKRATW
jgi:aminoglycoside 3-N-acetyltransferase